MQCTVPVLVVTFWLERNGSVSVALRLEGDEVERAKALRVPAPMRPLDAKGLAEHQRVSGGLIYHHERQATLRAKAGLEPAQLHSKPNHSEERVGQITRRAALRCP